MKTVQVKIIIRVSYIKLCKNMSRQCLGFGLMTASNWLTIHYDILVFDFVLSLFYKQQG